MNLFRKSSSYLESFRSIAQIPVSELSLRITASIDHSVSKRVLSCSYDRPTKTLTIHSLVSFNDPTDETQLKYTSVTFLRNNTQEIGKVVLSDEQDISNCRGYEIVFEIHEQNSRVDLRTVVRKNDENLSTEITDDKIDYTNDRFDTVFSENLSRRIAVNSNRYNSTYNNMFELSRYKDGVIISGERILDHNFVSYKYVPYAYKITVPDDTVKLFYCQWEGKFYAYKRIGDFVHYIELPSNVREIVVPNITANDPKYHIGNSPNFEFIKDGVIFNNGLNMRLGNQDHTASGSFKYIHPSYKPYTLITTNITRKPIEAINIEEDKELFLRYGKTDLPDMMSLYAIQNGVLKFKTNNRYCFIVKSRKECGFFSNRDETFLSPTKSYEPTQNKFYLYQNGKKSEINVRDLRFNYTEPIPAGQQYRILGRAVYAFKDNIYTLI